MDYNKLTINQLISKISFINDMIDGCLVIHAYTSFQSDSISERINNLSSEKEYISQFIAEEYGLNVNSLNLTNAFLN